MPSKDTNLKKKEESTKNEKKKSTSKEVIEDTKDSPASKDDVKIPSVEDKEKEKESPAKAKKSAEEIKEKKEEPKGRTKKSASDERARKLERAKKDDAAGEQPSAGKNLSKEKINEEAAPCEKRASDEGMGRSKERLSAENVDDKETPSKGAKKEAEKAAPVAQKAPQKSAEPVNAVPIPNAIPNVPLKSPGKDDVSQLEKSIIGEPRSNQMILIPAKSVSSLDEPSQDKSKLGTETEKSAECKGKEPPKQEKGDSAILFIDDTVNGPLEKENYYLGYMSQQGVASLLQEAIKTGNPQEGLFAVHLVALNHKPNLMLTLIHKGQVIHKAFTSVRKGTAFALNAHSATTVVGLINVHMGGIPINQYGADIRRPFSRPKWMWPPDCITLGPVLGKGAFGEVYQGTLVKANKLCAVKLMHDALPGSKRKPLTIEDKMLFMDEALVMRNLKHKNIIKMYGVSCLTEPMHLMMELASGGSLLKRVRSGNLGSKEKMNCCMNVLSGMVYLEKNHIIHRDLACRNVLIDSDEVCKISDFGLSVVGQSITAEKNIRVPIRWLAPETLTKRVFNNKTDVWSFGVTLWEVYTNGRIPYSHVKELKKVKVGVMNDQLRLNPVPDMPPDISHMLVLCLTKDQEKRPTFKYLKAEFKPKKSIKDRLMNRLGIAAGKDEKTEEKTDDKTGKEQKAEKIGKEQKTAEKPTMRTRASSNSTANRRK